MHTIHVKCQLKNRMPSAMICRGFACSALRLIHLSLASHKRVNSVDPDQTPQNAASDQGLHC